MIAVLDVTGLEAYIAGIITLGIFTIPLLTNFIKAALDAYTSVKELRPTVHDNSKKIAEHDRLLDGGLDERISSQVKGLISADRAREGDNAAVRALSTDGGESSTTSTGG